ncbi:MAG: acyl carrier protein, partial [Proteobacteria bacterium]
VRAILADVLGETIDVESSFIELGGDSLLAARATLQLSRELGCSVPMTMLLGARTISEFEQRLERTRADDPVE